MNKQRLFSSTVRMNTPSGEAAMRRRLVEAWQGRVTVSDLRRSVTETRFPTGETSRLLLTTAAFPPRYGAPNKLWNL